MFSAGLCHKLIIHRPYSLLRDSIYTICTYQLSFPLSAKRCIYTSSHSYSRVKKDYYQILGVSKDATSENIRDAYLHAAKKNHPDISGGTDSGRQFIDIKEAYEILSDKHKKENYDSVTNQSEDQLRYNSQWTGQYEDIRNSTHTSEEEKEIPYTRTEYVTYTYCAIVLAFALFVLRLYL